MQWDIRSWQKALVFWENQTNWADVKQALELGGREGGLSLWLAEKGVYVVCSDLENAQTVAEPLHKKYKIEQFVSYQDIDATNILYENHFDVIVFKSIVGGVGRNNNIEKQQLMFEQIHKALKPTGSLLFAENLVASPLHQFMRRRFSKAYSNAWRYITEEEINVFLSPFSSYTLQTTGFLATFGRSETQRNFLAHIDELLFNWLLPRTWKYIVYGVAKK
jgi:SAM-dependent methyltransferase